MLQEKVSPKALFCSSERASSACHPARDCEILTPLGLYQPSKETASSFNLAQQVLKTKNHFIAHRTNLDLVVLDLKLWSSQAQAAKKSSCTQLFKSGFVELCLGFVFPFISIKKEDQRVWAVLCVPDENSSTGCTLKGHCEKYDYVKVCLTRVSDRDQEWTLLPDNGSGEGKALIFFPFNYIR